ncbi:MAG: tetratricopeptide repeat protein, partial [Candidatus Aminicenantes bacterium]
MKKQILLFRRGGCQIPQILLCALFLFLFVKGGFPQIQPVRTINLKVVVDEEYKKNKAWRINVSRLVSGTSMIFEKNFGIRFRIKSLGTWNSDNTHISMRVLLTDLQRSVPLKDCDIVLGFTDQLHLDHDLYGVASYLYGYILLRDVRFFSSERIMLLHEICHLFGAVDLKQKGSIMSSTSPDVKFDEFTRKIIFLNKHRRFNPYIFPLPEEKWDRAVELYTQRKGTNGGELDVHILLALFYLEREDYPSLIKECLQAGKIDPYLPEVHNLLGIAYRRTGRIDHAIEEYNKVLELQPDLTEVHYNLGIAYMKKGKNDEAIAEYKKAIALDPNYAKAYSNLGHLYLEMGYVDLAIKEVQKALRIYPKLPEALTTLGAALIAKQEYKEAERVSLQALEIDPGLSGVHNNLGSVYMSRKKFDKAV